MVSESIDVDWGELVRLLSNGKESIHLLSQEGVVVHL